jgi:DNA-directed RNA polymerase specialized sigma24 family protein
MRRSRTGLAKGAAGSSTPATTNPLKALLAGGLQPAAAAELFATVQRIANACAKGACPEQRRDFAQDLYIKLHTALQGGALPRDIVEGPVAAAAGYIWGMARNLWIDQFRRGKKRERPVGDTTAGGGEDLGRFSIHDLYRGDPRPMLALLRKALDRAKLKRKPRYRKALDVAWEQLLEMAFECLTAKEVLKRHGLLGPSASPRQVKRAEDRLFKALERCRDALVEGIDLLEEEGALNFAEVLAAERVARLLSVKIRRARIRLRQLAANSGGSPAGCDPEASQAPGSANSSSQRRRRPSVS